MRGSAPWVRGTRTTTRKPAADYRFSPVGTGNTFLQFETGGTCAVQPRGYGEHQGALIALRVLGGSAPWVRGTHPLGELGP